MYETSRSRTLAVVLAMSTLALSVRAVRADEPPRSDPPPADPAAVAALEQRLREQAVQLDELRQALVRQQAKIDELLRERDARAAVVRPVTSPASASAPESVRSAPVQDEALVKRVDAIEKRFGNVRLSGDLRVRAEGFYNQGFDASRDVDPRNRLRFRARVQLVGDIDEHFDWGLRLASGSFNDPTSTNVTADNYFDRKPIAIDRAYLHFTTRTKPAEFDVYAGKFDPPWKYTSVTFDPDVQVEGLSERLKVDTGDATPLRRVTLVAWQLPFRERSVGADGLVVGGQVLTDWKWSANWSSSLGATFHDFEQANLIPSALGVSPTLVNAGLEGSSMNVIVIDPITNLPRFRSKFRVVDAIGELTYAGWGKRWPVVLNADYIHNTSAFNNQSDGGRAGVQIGRAAEAGDWQVAYNFWKVEREAFVSNFMESDITLQTNSVGHLVYVTYAIEPRVQLVFNYFPVRRLQTTSPVNRYLQRVQFDVIYRF